MKKIFTILLFVAGFRFTASAQESAATTTASTAPKASCCSAGAKTASTDKASCSATTASASTTAAQASATQSGHVGLLPPGSAAGTAPAEKKASCCAGEAKAEAKKSK